MKTPPKGWWLGLLGALIVLTAAGLYLSQGQPPIRRAPRLEPTAMRIAPGLYLLGGLAPSAAYVVETSRGLVLVDAGLDADAGVLKREMASLGLDWRAVRAVLLTHVHGDHCGGAETLREQAGAEIYAGRGDADLLRAGTPKDAFFSVFHMPGHEPHPTTVDRELSGGEVLRFGDVTFRAIATPGHTPGSVCYLMERGAQRVLFSGDVITKLVGIPGAWSQDDRPLGTYSAYLPPHYRGDAAHYLASLKALRKLPSPQLVLPGHPRSDPSPPSPLMTEKRWHEILDDGIAELTTLVERYRRDGADFLDGNRRELLPGLDYLGDFRGSAVYGIETPGGFYVVGAPSEAGFLAFVERHRGPGKRASMPISALLLTSCSPAEIAGLPELVERSNPRIVAPNDEVRLLERMLPKGSRIVRADAFAREGTLPVQSVPLPGAGVAPVGYLLDWHGKRVLFTDEVPTLFDHDSTERLTAELEPSRENVLEYLLSLRTLEPLRPDLWLPQHPTQGQNANLYDRSWKEIISMNYRFGNHLLTRQH